MRAAHILGVCALTACGAADPASGRAVVPGERIGPVALDASWADVTATIGEPAQAPLVLVRVGQASWPAQGLEVLATSPADSALTPDAIIIGVAATRDVQLDGLELIGATRASVELALGPAPEAYGGRGYYPSGLAIEYGGDDVVDKVAVFAGYVLAPEPPPMRPAAGGAP